MAQIDKFLEMAMSQRSSDLHLSSGECPRARVDGDLVPISEVSLRPEDTQALLFEILTAEERDRLVKNKNLDKSYTLPNIGFFRVNIYYTRRGLSAVLRTIPTKIPTMEDLNLPPSVKKLADAAKGLVLVTGPTGSGKSTTLASMIDYLNTNYNYHILTAEDPVEFVHPTKKSLVNQREIGSSCPSFADALKYALREDPDVILVGEMRDLETIALAITAAETGHLVFGTLHTRGAGASVDRIIDSFPANQQGMIRAMLSESLVGVVSQTLLKRQDKPGRIAAFEILVTNHAVSNLIREGKTFQIPSIMQTSKRDGMILMDQNILELVESGIVSPAEAAPYMDNPTVLTGKGKVIPQQPKVAAPAQPTTKPPMAPPGGPAAPPLSVAAPASARAIAPARAPIAVPNPAEAIPTSPPEPEAESPGMLLDNDPSLNLGLEAYAGEIAETEGTQASVELGDGSLLDVSVTEDSDDQAEPTIAYGMPKPGEATAAAPAPVQPAPAVPARSAPAPGPVRPSGGSVPAPPPKVSAPPIPGPSAAAAGIPNLKKGPLAPPPPPLKKKAG